MANGLCPMNLEPDNKRKLLKGFTKAFFTHTPITTGRDEVATLKSYINAIFDKDSENGEQILKTVLLEWVTDVKRHPRYKINPILKDNIDKIEKHADDFIHAVLAEEIVNPIDIPNMEIDDGQTLDVVTQVSLDTLNDLYRSAQQPRTLMQKLFRRTIISSIFIDYTLGKLVKSQYDLNLNIAQKQLLWVNDIVAYYRLLHPDVNLPDIKIYSEEGKFDSDAFIKLIHIVQDLFKDFTDVKLNNLFKNRFITNSGIALQAYNSWVMLNNFDVLLKGELGKTIGIKSGTKKGFVNVDDLKYYVDKTSNVVKTWRTNENVDITLELGSITKLLIEDAPMYEYSGKIANFTLDRLLAGLTLELQGVLYAFSKVRSHPLLHEDMLIVRFNPMVYLPKVIERALSDANFGDDNILVKNTLYSVYKRFFKLDNSLTDTDYSLVEIMNREAATNDKVLLDNLLTYIMAAIDKANPNVVVEHVVNQELERIVPRYSSVNSLEVYKYMVLDNINNLNQVLNKQDKLDLMLKFKITNNNKDHLFEFQIDFTYNGKNYRFRFNNIYKKLEETGFDVEVSPNIYEPALDNDSINALIYLIDNTLYLNLNKRQDLLSILLGISTYEDDIDTLRNVALLSGRVLIKHREDLKAKDKLFDTFAMLRYYGLTPYLKDEIWFDKRTKSVKSIISDSKTNDLVKLIARALIILSGELAKSVTRNLEGNAIATEGLTNYAQATVNTFILARTKQDSAASELIFAKNPGLIKGIVVKGAAQTVDRLTVRANQDFNVKEITYSAIMQDFLMGYTLNKDIRGLYSEGTEYDMLFMPTVPSDKKNIPTISINKSLILDEYKKTSVGYLSVLQIHDWHFKTMSNAFEKLKSKIESDFRKIIGQLQIDYPNFNTLASLKSVVISENLDFDNIVTKIFPIINELAFDLNIGATLLIREVAQKFPEITLIDNEHFLEKNSREVEKDILEPNPTLLFYFKMFNGQDKTIYNLVIHKNKEKTAKHCIKNLKIYWTNLEGVPDLALEGAVIKLKFSGTLKYNDIDIKYQNISKINDDKHLIELALKQEEEYISRFKSLWVNPDNLLMAIAAMTVNGLRKLLFKEDLDLLNPSYDLNDSFELNPIMDTYYAYDNMFSTQFITSSVGGVYLHKNLHKGKSKFEKGTLEYFEEDEGGRLLTLYKRMAILPATMHNYLLEKIDGCGTLYNVSIIEDPTSPLYNFLDKLKDHDVLDGSGFADPVTAILENHSLTDAKVGLDKKTIGHSFTNEYLSGHFFKWALYALTNERVALSNSGIDLKRIRKKMSDIPWDTDGLTFDITKTYWDDILKKANSNKNQFRRENSVSDFGKNVYFKADDLYDEIVSLELYDTVDYLYTIHPELEKIGSKELYILYLRSVYPDSQLKDIYWHGSNSDFSDGFNSAIRGQGSGAPETGSEMYFARQPWSVLLYVDNINRENVDVNGYAIWNKLWWELKQILGNGRSDNSWKNEVIQNVRQEIPNKRGQFDRNDGGEHGSYLTERKADYGYLDKTDEEFFRDIFGIEYGVDTFNTWVQRNKDKFLEIWRTQPNIHVYPVLLNVQNPITESGQNTYYEEQRGLFTKAKVEGNDAILSSNADNEFNSDVAVILNPQENVTFLGSNQDIEGFKLFVPQTIDKPLLIEGNYYKVTGIKNIGTNLYSLTVVQVSNDGKYIGQEFNILKEINSNYKLWEAFGAEWSYELVNDNLVLTDVSNEVVAWFANNTGFSRTSEDEEKGTIIKPEYIFLGSKEEVEEIQEKRKEGYSVHLFRSVEELADPSKKAIISLRDIYLPMKYSGISYLVNKSAIKHGAANTNPQSSWYNGKELNSFIVNTIHFGLLMDTDHTADDAEVSEMTQVIAALEANGLTHELAKLAYIEIGELIYLNLKPYLKAIEKFYQQGDSKALYEVVARTFLSAFKGTLAGRSDLGDALIYNIKKKLGKNASLVDNNVWIPFSDNAIMSKLVATITSEINNSAIKRKYAGLGAILIPSYDLIRIYQGTKGDISFKSLVDIYGTRKRAKMELERKTLSSQNPELNCKQIELGKSYVIVNDGYRKITFNKLEDYYEYRKRTDLIFKEDFTEGRNLLPARITFKYTNPETGTEEIYDVYETAAVKNRLAYSNWYLEFKDSNDGFNYTKENINKLIELSKRLIHHLPDVQRLILKINNIEKNSPENLDTITFYVKLIGEYFKDEVIKMFEDLHNGNVFLLEEQLLLDGTKLTSLRKINIDPRTIVTKEAELVVSKIYATKFGLTIGTNLNDVDEEFFRKQIEKNIKVSNNNFDVAFKRQDGRHVYVVTPEHELNLVQKGFYEVKASTEDDPFTESETYELKDGRYVENGKTIMTYRVDPVTNKKMYPFTNCKLYLDNFGNEYVVTNNLKQFVDLDDEFDSIEFNANAQVAFQTLRAFNIDSNLLTECKQCKSLLELISKTQSNLKRLISKLARAKYVSFLKSLEFVGARIPAQSMQSFMPMKVVAFTDSEENKAYVSHFLTFLQGSDYDIDKLYLLGNEFDDNGIYIGWSPLFDLSSKKLLEKSEELPMPTGLRITIIDTNDKDLPNGIDLTGEFRILLEAEREIKLSLDAEIRENAKIVRLNSMIRILNTLNNSSDNTNFYCKSNLLISGNHLTFKEEVDEIENLISSILRRINKHLNYFDHKSKDFISSALKNSISSKMRRIINDHANMVLAYSPIEMETSREAGNRSPLGKLEREYSMADPTVKFIMRELNMIGKRGIGITAVGEKILFNLQYYYNELARTPNLLKQIRGLFHKTIEFKKGWTASKVVRNIIANVNIPTNVTEKELYWLRYIRELLDTLETALQNGNISQQDYDYLSEILLMQTSVMTDSALVNSSLLSAATDNAKELILSKINANPDMLKIYTYSIVLGIDFNVIADFMTSNTVTVINNIALANIFDNYEARNNVNSALRLLKYGHLTQNFSLEEIKKTTQLSDSDRAINYLIFLMNGTKYLDLDQKIIRSSSRTIPPLWSRFYDTLTHQFRDFSPRDVDIAIQDLDRVKENIVNKYVNKKHNLYLKAMRYIDATKELLLELKKTNKHDLDLFETLSKNGDELKNFGRLLSLNLGLKTNIQDKMNFLTGIELMLQQRVRAIHHDFSYDNIMKLLPQLKGILTKQLVNAIILKAKSLGILKEKEVKGRTVVTSDLNALKFIQDEEYLQATVLFYDLIKATINIFDAIITVPHYKAMLKAAAVDFILFLENSSKFALTYDLVDTLGYSNLDVVQKVQLKRDIMNFLLDVITNKYFKERKITLTITGGYYDKYMEFKPNEENKEIPINLGTTYGLASFKYWFENTVIPNLKRGIYDDKTMETLLSLKDNRFIMDLSLTTTNRTLTRSLKYLYTLPMNMSNIRSMSDINNFTEYLSSFTELESYLYNNIPIVRLFSFYNLITYKNQYGRDSLTRIFENYMLKENNEMLDYFDFVGLLDYNRLLTKNDFSKRDLQIACAPRVSMYNLVTRKEYLGPYVKTWNSDTGSDDIYVYNRTKNTGYSSNEYDDILAMDEMEQEMREEAIMNGFDDWEPDYVRGDSWSYKRKDPLKYDPVIKINANKDSLMNYFPFLDTYLLEETISKPTSEILKELFMQGKILIYNDCK